MLPPILWLHLHWYKLGMHAEADGMLTTCSLPLSTGTVMVATSAVFCIIDRHSRTQHTPATCLYWVPSCSEVQRHSAPPAGSWRQKMIASRAADSTINSCSPAKQISTLRTSSTYALNSTILCTPGSKGLNGLYTAKAKVEGNVLKRSKCTLSQGAGWSVSRCSCTNAHVDCFSNSPNSRFSNASRSIRNRLLSVTVSVC